MDPIAHTLVGASLAETRLKQLSTLATPTLILGANAPDIDAVTILLSRDLSLGFRRGWTHGVLAMAVLPLALAALLLLADRSIARLRGRPARARVGPVVALSYLAVLTPPGTRLAQHLRHPSADAVRRSLVLWRRAVHCRPMGVAARGNGGGTSLHAVGPGHHRMARGRSRPHGVDHRLGCGATCIEVGLGGGRGLDRRSSGVWRPAPSAPHRSPCVSHLPSSTSWPWSAGRASPPVRPPTG